MRRLTWAAAAPVVISAMLILSACGGTSAKLSGTALDKQPAPDFTLTDQNGQTVTLSALRGNAIALTFIYTHCTDVCPLIAQNLQAAYQDLSPAAQHKVKLLAVTVDPARDDPAALAAFSKSHSLAGNPNWHALTGDPATLASVWKGYYIDASGMIGESATPASPGATATNQASPDTVSITHTDAIYIIDAQGNERVLMRSTADPKQIADNLSALVR